MLDTKVFSEYTLIVHFADVRPFKNWQPNSGNEMSFIRKYLSHRRSRFRVAQVLWEWIKYIRQK